MSELTIDAKPLFDASDVDDDDLMVHIWDEKRTDGEWAICGTKLHGIEADAKDLDCVVCAELAPLKGYILP